MFSIDTDAHAPGQLEWQILGVRKAVACGVGRQRVINALTADDLQAWTSTGAVGRRPGGGG
jgi:putative hydrolase